MHSRRNITISIITVCKNSQAFLEDTIKSVVSQSYKHIQYIIIDGASVDNTINIIEKNIEYVDFFFSEKDNGMYDAINKGLRAATGDYILILNSDDVLASDNSIANVVKYIDQGELDYYYGNLIKLNEGKDKKVKLFRVKHKQLLLSTHGTFVPHPCFFISADLNRRIGGYSLDYKYASDYDYILRALAVPGVTGRYMNTYITKFRIHENSITASGKIDVERKEILVKQGYYKNSNLIRLYYYYSLWIYYKIINLSHFYTAV